jgi:integrase
MEDEERLFNCDIEAYIADRIGFYQNTTLKEQGRKLRYFGQIFGDLREEGKIGTEDPAKIGPAEISAFLQHMRDKGIDVATQSKYIQVLNNYLVFKDNMIISKMKGSRRFPSPAKKPIKSLSVDEVQHIFDTVQEMDGWTGTQARGIVALAFETLARPSELRLAQAREPEGQGILRIGTVGGPDQAGRSQASLAVRGREGDLPGGPGQDLALPVSEHP